MNAYLLIAALGIISLVPFADAQVINVTQAQPCFLNETAGPRVWENCNFDEDWLAAILLPWEWISGGNFSMILVSVLIMFTYIKYHKVVYPMLVGTMFIPISYFLFPDQFIIWAVIMTFVAAGLLVAFIYLKQTKEYG